MSVLYHCNSSSIDPTRFPYTGITHTTCGLLKMYCRFLGADDGVLARNFAVYGGLDGSGSKEELCWKETADTYKCYASGRRYCSGALLTLKLKPRQDLFQQTW